MNPIPTIRAGESSKPEIPFDFVKGAKNTEFKKVVTDAIGTMLTRGLMSNKGQPEGVTVLLPGFSVPANVCARRQLFGRIYRAIIAIFLVLFVAFVLVGAQFVLTREGFATILIFGALVGYTVYTLVQDIKKLGLGPLPEMIGSQWNRYMRSKGIREACEIFQNEIEDAVRLFPDSYQNLELWKELVGGKYPQNGNIHSLFSECVYMVLRKYGREIVEAEDAECWRAHARLRTCFAEVYAFAKRMQCCDLGPWGEYFPAGSKQSRDTRED